MALTSPGVEVQVIDQSQYLPAAPGSVPFVLLATAQDKVDPNGVSVAAATTSANANKLYQVTSQRDLVTLYGNPTFYTSSNGTPLQGYELNEYGLLAAYSLLGVTNRCYVLRADIDLASLVGTTGRPVGYPENGTVWLDTTDSTWGIYEFNATTSSFVLQNPIVITDSTDMSAGVPIQTIGSIGNYAVYAAPQEDNEPGTVSQFFYKTTSNNWVTIGSSLWKNDWPTIEGTESNPVLDAGDTFSINLDGDVAVALTVPDAGGGVGNVMGVATEINNLGWAYISAAVRNGRLCIFESYPEDAISPPRFLTISNGTGTALDDMGIDAGTYYQPLLQWATAAQQPLWQSSQQYPRPTGSVWMKAGGTGLNPVIQEWSNITEDWVTKEIALAQSDEAVNATLDPTGGQAIPAGTIYGQYNFNNSSKITPVNFWKRTATGPTVVTGTNTAPDFSALGPDATGPYLLYVSVSSPNSSTSSTVYTVTINEGADASDFVIAWSTAGIPYTTATVATSGAIQITHTEGGSISIFDVLESGTNKGQSCGALVEAGFIAGTTDNVKYYNSAVTTFNNIEQSATSGSGTGLEITVSTSYGIYLANSSPNAAGSGYALGELVTFDGADLGGETGTNNLVLEVTSVDISGGVTSLTFISGNAATVYGVLLSNWVEFTYTSNDGAPAANPPNNQNWFYSVVDEVDIMINFNGAWRGYKNQNYDLNGFPSPTGVNATDPAGPIVSATEPTTQSDGTALVFGDLWISTADLENYPVIYRWQSVGGASQWVLLDNSDQTNPTGVLFADARWATNGTTSVTEDPIPTIASLLTSNYLDIDAPDDALYPTGMLLFNTRRSGYNVKQFKANYFSNANFPGESLPVERDAWVSVSGLQSNGSPYMGRKAQRAMVVEALRAAIDTNTDLRDEDNFFNLMATPNYPELQPNMIVLNADRGETGYILGDTPMGLSDSATDIQAWATNAAGALSTGEEGCVNRNTYLGLFYPSGITSDLSGNLVAVPPSHMMLRTFLRNDTIAYPWLAAAGTRRGIIDNAANIGYVNRTTGEFQVIKTRLGIRDVLYVNFINPLVFFTGQGLLNYGNKTSFNSSSALDRTNVARLVAYMRRQLTLAGRPYVFEPNDAFTRGQIANTIESLCLDLVAKRGIYDYLVVCDESNNTPARIDRNELWVDVAIEPVKAAEFIYIPVRILNTGELSGA
jgi:phage tail sheath protein FI